MRFVVTINDSYAYGPFNSLQSAQNWIVANVTDGSVTAIIQLINIAD